MIKIGSGQNKIKSIVVVILLLSVIFTIGYFIGYYGSDFFSALSN